MKVTKIKAFPSLERKKNVAAYARVSSGKDAMLHSLSSQVSYYSKYIQSHSDWEYVGVYADEALTGTKDTRKEFQRMLADCRNGKIDMVITKSISRFARNTVTLLETVRELKKLGILTVSGKQKWSASTVRSILTNERYKGDALLQKKFTVDFLTKKMKVNEGEVPQYYVEDSHPAIITKREFDIVQAEIARRKKLGSSYSGNDIFSSKILCADCGGFYGSKLWHSKDKYKCTIYQCNNKFKNAEKCKTPNLTADDIRNAFIKAYNIVMADRTTVLEDCKIMIDTVCNSTKLNEEIDALTAELKVVSELVSECVNENARKKQSQDAYTKKYNSLVRRYERAEKHLNKATAEREDKVNKERELRLFFETLENKPQLIDTWDENLWITLVEKIEVSHDKMCTVFFKNGIRVKVDI